MNPLSGAGDPGLEARTLRKRLGRIRRAGIRARQRLQAAVLSRLRTVRHLVRGLAPGRLARSARWTAGLWRESAARRHETRLTVAVDISALWEPLTGIGWYLYQLLEHLKDRPDLRLRLYGPAMVASEDAPRPVVGLPTGPALELVSVAAPDDLSLPPSLLVPALRLAGPWLIAADANQVVFAPNYYPPPRFGLCRGALVATILDVGFLRVPWTLREETLGLLGRHLASTLFRADRLLTISHSVEREMTQAGLAHPRRIRAIHLGPGQLSDVEPAPPPAGLEQPLALFVGTIEPRKNLAVVLEAWRRLAERGSDPPLLVICGRYGWKSETDRSEVEEAEARGWARHLGYVEDRVLAGLYRRATLVVFPSLYEGFGLPVLEAMRSGTPVVASDIPVLREVGGEAVLYAPPLDADAWVERVERVLADEALADRLRRAGLERAERFTWHRAAEETLAVWREAALEGGADGVA